MNLSALARYVRDARLPRWRRWLVLGAVLYVVSPLDLIPDAIPVLGWLDDAGVLGAVLMFLMKDVARHERGELPAQSALVEQPRRVRVQ